MADTSITYRSVKSLGRAHLACQRCRSHKIKCSGEKPTCRNCSVSEKECHYPGRDRIVTVNESDIIKLQYQIKSYEKKLSLSDPNFVPKGESEKEVIKDNYFHNATTTDSSLFSFLDVDSDDEVVEPSNGENLRYYYSESNSSAPVSSLICLPDQESTMALVQKVIGFIGYEYYLFDSNEFIERVNSSYAQGLQAEDPAWASYLLITLAIGEQFSNASNTTEAPGISYYRKFRKIFNNDFEEPSIQMIQVYLLLAFYQQGLNRSNSIFVTYGVATRLALSMGLHRKAKNLSLEEREKRRRLWWTCYVMDSIWAAKLGQPIHVDSADISVELDEIVDLQDGFKVDMLKRNSQLAIVLGRIMEKMYQPTARRTIGELLHCIQELNDYQKNLPRKLRENIITKGDRTTANLYLRLNQIVIITTRPLVLSMFIGKKHDSFNTPEVKQAVQKCIGSASANINILDSLKEINLFSDFGFWDARYLFSSLLILYMVSNGESYSDLIEIGRSLNRSMASSGNFTAVENEKRFKELDTLFMKMRDQPATSSNTPKPSDTTNQSVVSPNTLLVDDIAKIFTDISSLDSESHVEGLFESLSRTDMPEIWRDITWNLKSWDNSGR